ncbi:GNAT family N-acetyltransferase [Streptacidiphilus jiangxiensis]|uniref:Acetyltransferase (GNAT) family protein n=1 Tax=Streptacidiphilus jiangxiensis TaxID=235985 RepID=A0A1H7J0H7_STRJI|nr:GNAT family N-acetyltransferase [Streptacidiphilus jiangxiensis]SEK68136.1 Acetyltransferase (GNAT) family protein [Streptacidiphilus jiangxiensis]
MSADSATELAWRPLERADVPAWHRLLVAIEAVEQEDENPTEADVLTRFDDPYVDMARGSLAVWDGGRMVGYHYMKARTVAEASHDFWQFGGVDPQYRGRGVGGRLLTWAEDAARALSDERFPGVPVVMNDGCGVGSTASERLFAQLGYEPSRWYRNMVVADLAATVPALPESPAPDGVEFRVFTQERSADALAVRNEAFVDHYDSVPQTPEGWAHFTGGPAFRAGNSFVAYDAGRGTPLAIVLAEEYVTPEGRELYVALVGTVRAGRKRGIASALLAHTMRVGLADGYTRSCLGVDAESPTGAVGLYERLGYRAKQTWVAQRKPLDA